ncbi:hypothetical protein BJX68DRAFT_270823 [Aspergillus pseudodeflectus]|uniref:Uncharacterized protein n=1 Tax=Aspergillus pseudodeflectus TaxID=176178 RepID=A0ABR4JQ00_9EURO
MKLLKTIASLAAIPYLVSATAQFNVYSGTECAQGFVRDFFIDAGGTGDIYLENLNVKAVGIVNSSNYHFRVYLRDGSVVSATQSDCVRSSAGISSVEYCFWLEDCGPGWRKEQYWLGDSAESASESAA